MDLVLSCGTAPSSRCVLDYRDKLYTVFLLGVSSRSSATSLAESELHSLARRRHVHCKNSRADLGVDCHARAKPIRQISRRKKVLGLRGHGKLQRRTEPEALCRSLRHGNWGIEIGRLSGGNGEP